MSSLLFIENSQPFPGVLFSVLKKHPEFQIDRAFSPVHAINKMKERRYNLVIMCGQEADTRLVQEAAKGNGAAFVSVDIVPAQPQKDRSGYLRGVKLTLEDFHHSAESTLSGFKNERDLFLAASDRVVHYIRDHFQAVFLDKENLQIFEVLEGSRMGVAVINGRKLQKVNSHLAGLLGYAPEEVPPMEFPDIFSSEAEYREFSRTMSQDKNGAGWHCSTRMLATKKGDTVSCTMMVRRLDDFNPLKGHLMIIEKTADPAGATRKLWQVIGQENAGSRSLEESIAALPGIVLVTDSDGTITHANAEALRAFGYGPEELEGRNLVGTIVPEQSRYARQMIAMVNDPVFCRDGYAIHAFENMRKTGEKLWVAWKILALRDKNDRIYGMLLLGEDITERETGTPGRIRADPWKYQVLAGTQVQENVFDAVFHLCVDISREGREGHVVGTSFVIGDTGTVMAHSRPCTINSFEGQPTEKRQVTRPDIGEVIKGLAQMDGAFVIRDDGFIEASGRHFIIDNLVLKIPEGYGTRHSSVAGITQMTNAIGFVVSTTGGKISVLKNGEIKKTLTV